jgi:hypothetical protein
VREALTLHPTKTRERDVFFRLRGAPTVEERLALVHIDKFDLGCREGTGRA